MLCRRWSVRFNLFASSLIHRCGVCFAPVLDPMAVGAVAMLQSWDFSAGWCIFPLFALIPQVLVKLQSFPGAVLTLIAPFWPQGECFPDLLLESPLPLPDR